MYKERQSHYMHFGIDSMTGVTGVSKEEASSMGGGVGILYPCGKAGVSLCLYI